MPLIATPGAPDANAYATYTEYQAYWQARLYGAVPLAAAQPTAEAALEWSTLLLDSLLNWKGASTVPDVQALAWPRTGLISPTGASIDPATIPPRLKQANAEFAGVLIINGDDRTLDNPAMKQIGGEQKVTGVKAGSVSLSFAGGTFSSLDAFYAYIRSISPDFAYLSKAMPDSVRALIPPSWYVQAQLKQPLIIEMFSGGNADPSTGNNGGSGFLN